MKVETSPQRLKAGRSPIFLAAGFFDGLHRGHRRVIDAMIQSARDCHGQAWVLTFDPHPLRVLGARMSPPLLTATAHKLRVLSRLDLDGCLVMRFTPALAACSPEQFVARLCRNIPALTAIFVGRNWRFGNRGAGNAQRLAELGRTFGFDVHVVRPVLRHRLPVSSTRIREEVRAGNLSEARALLGRPFSVLGTVVSGRTLGRTLGFPTANLKTRNEALPPDGVYAVFAAVRGRCHRAVLNLGRRPTVRQGGELRPVLELHLLDFKRNLYGDAIEVFFVRRLREERRFDTTGLLRNQIARDVQRARTVLEKSLCIQECGVLYSRSDKRKKGKTRQRIEKRNESDR